MSNADRNAIINMSLSAFLAAAVLHPGALASADQHADGTAVLAISGFDPVAYFDQSTAEAIAGDPMFSVTHDGMEYRFVSSEHVMEFTASPRLFQPVFGGNDPSRLEQGAVVAGDPRISSVIDGGLFLFTSEQTRDRWLRSFDALVLKASSNWDNASEEPTGASFASSLDRNTAKYLTKKDLGAGGYDVVSYFPEAGSKPAKGSKKHVVEYRGVRYAFANEDNLERFKRRPSRYEPAYGGWCAYAIAHEDYTKPNPKRFLIQNDRLLLFYDGIAGDTYKRWHKEGTAKLEGLADRWWESESGEKAAGAESG